MFLIRGKILSVKECFELRQIVTASFDLTFYG